MFESTVPDTRWAWLFSLPEVQQQLSPVSPTLEELKSLLLACNTLAALNQLKRTHKKAIAASYHALTEVEQAHVDGLAALAVPHKVYKYLGEEIKQGSQRLIRGTLVYIDPQTQLRSTARSARVWAINGVPSGWQQSVEVSLNLLKEIVKVVKLDDENSGQ